VGLPQGTRARAVTPRRGMGTHDDYDDGACIVKYYYVPPFFFRRRAEE
jgi:hypothetical protein